MPLWQGSYGSLPAPLKGFAERVTTTALALRVRRSTARIGIAFCYHRIDDPAGSAERELVPALGSDRFAAEVRLLGSRYELVTAAELREAALMRAPGRRIPAAITFDDDLPTHVSKAMPALLAAGAPATFFLSGASLEAPFAFWWERLQGAWDAGIFDGPALARLGVEGLGESPTIHQVAAAVEDLTPGDRARVATELGSLAGSDPADAGMRSADVAALVSEGFEIGFHTRRHDRLTGLADAALERALHDGREELERVAGISLRSVSYPHGKADPRVGRAAATAGFDQGFVVNGAPLLPSTDPFLIGRRYLSSGPLVDLDLDVARTLRAAARAPELSRSPGGASAR